MSDKHLKGPDEKFEVAGKDSAHELTGIDKNKQKPDELKPKGEPSSTSSDEEDEEDS